MSSKIVVIYIYENGLITTHTWESIEFNAPNIGGKQMINNDTTNKPKAITENEWSMHKG